MLKPAIGIAIFMALLLLIPQVWPDGYTASVLPMVVLLLVAAVAAALIGRRRRMRGWGTESSAAGEATR